MYVQQMENMQIEAIFFMLHAINLIKVLQNVLTEIKVHFRLLTRQHMLVVCAISVNRLLRKH